MRPSWPPPPWPSTVNGMWRPRLSGCRRVGALWSPNATDQHLVAIVSSARRMSGCIPPSPRSSPDWTSETDTARIGAGRASWSWAMVCMGPCRARIAYANDRLQAYASARDKAGSDAGAAVGPHLHRPRPAHRDHRPRTSSAASSSTSAGASTAASTSPARPRPVRTASGPTSSRPPGGCGYSNIRYPGGNFVSAYRWRDGVGPVEERPDPLRPGLERDRPEHVRHERVHRLLPAPRRGALPRGQRRGRRHARGARLGRVLQRHDAHRADAAARGARLPGAASRPLLGHRQRGRRAVAGRLQDARGVRADVPRVRQGHALGGPEHQAHRLGRLATGTATPSSASSCSSSRRPTRSTTSRSTGTSATRPATCPPTSRSPSSSRTGCTAIEGLSRALTLKRRPTTAHPHRGRRVERLVPGDAGRARTRPSTGSRRRTTWPTRSSWRCTSTPSSATRASVRMANLAQLVNVIAPMVDHAGRPAAPDDVLPVRAVQHDERARSRSMPAGPATRSRGGDHAGVRLLDVSATLDEERPPRRASTSSTAGWTARPRSSCRSMAPASAPTSRSSTIAGPEPRATNTWEDRNNIATELTTLRSDGGGSLVQNLPPHSVTAFRFSV